MAFLAAAAFAVVAFAAVGFVTRDWAAFAIVAFEERVEVSHGTYSERDSIAE
jgi:hypothetical protein